MERLKPIRQKKVPPEILKGFSASIEARLRKNQPSLEIKLKPKRSWIPVWAPVFVVLIIGSILVLKMPPNAPDILLVPKTVELAQATPNQISDEIAVLSEVGAWTEDDEKSAGVPAEGNDKELDLSKAVSRLDTTLI